MKEKNIRKLTIAGVLVAVAVVGSLFSIPVFGAKCSPVQHMVNVLGAVLLGPGYAVGMAFAAAMAFDENAPEIALNGIDDLTSLKQMLAPFVQGNPNLFYMIKAGGVFKTMHTQSWNSCRKPYPVLSEAAKSWNEFRFENTRGNVIAVWCPRYVDGICIPDWHFHYLSSDKTQGGHILDLSAERLHLKINRIGRFDLLLPQTTEFAHCELREGKSAAAERFAACQATADKLL